MKKNEKNMFYNLKKDIFFTFFLVAPLALHFKDDFVKLKKALL
jgi:hypothetical protein